MPDNDDPNEFVSDDGNQQPEKGGTLRKQLEAALATIKTQGAENSQLKEQVTQLTLKTAFDELKVPEKTRGFYSGEATPDAVKAWVEENKDVFNFTPAVTTEQAQPTEQEQALAAINRANQLGGDMANFATDAFKLKANEVKKTSPNKNPDALAELFAQIGVPVGGYSAPRTG